MANSKRFKILVDRVNFLNSNILPPIKIGGDYTPVEYDYTRSYILLVHAEIESFLEEKVSEKVNISLSNWKTNRKKSTCLKSILAFCSNDINYEKKKIHERNSLEFRVNIITNHFLSLIKKNHGIKKDNILDLLLPIGIEIDELDETWLTTMDNFGAKRGEIAHHTTTVQKPIDPLTEKKLINDIILPELSVIDRLLINLK